MRKDVNNVDMKLYRIIPLVVLVILLLGQTVFAVVKDLPEYTDYVNDYTSTLSQTTIAQLNQQLKAFDKQTTTQIAVAIVKTTGEYPIEDYSLELARKWGMGQKKTNNGILLLIAKDDRTLRIEVGYGLEGVLTDIQSKWIIDNAVTPRFKEGNFDQGIIDGVQKITAAVSKEEIIPSTGNSSSTGSSNWDGIIAFLVMSFFYGGTAFLARNKSYWEGPVIGAVVGGLFLQDIIGVIVFAIFGLILDLVVSQTGGGKSSSGSGWSSGSSGWSSGSSFGGSSSGGTSFGGGSFGGGGSSGRW